VGSPAVVGASVVAVVCGPVVDATLTFGHHLKKKKWRIPNLFDPSPFSIANPKSTRIEGRHRLQFRK
jgi:hypothetical protein